MAVPTILPMYGSRSRKVKTDGRDTAALSRRPVERECIGPRIASRLRAARRGSRCGVRRHLVRMRSRSICLLRAVLRQDGWRLPKGSVEAVEARLEQLALPAGLATILAPLRSALRELNALIAHADRHGRGSGRRRSDRPSVNDGPRRRARGRADVSGRYSTTPARFGGDAARASAFLGLVPSENSSAERRHKGHVPQTRSARAAGLAGTDQLGDLARPKCRPARRSAHGRTR